MAKLTYQTEEGESITVEIDSVPFQIGRKSNNDLTINDSTLSRHHCEIRRGNDGFVVKDLDSKNGTLVNGDPVEQWTLKPGDRIQLGQATLTFQAKSTESDLPSEDHSFSPLPSRIGAFNYITARSTPSFRTSYILLGAILLIGGGLLAYLFSGSPAEQDTEPENMMMSADELLSEENWNTRGPARVGPLEERGVSGITFNFEQGLSRGSANYTSNLNVNTLLENNEGFHLEGYVWAPELNGFGGMVLEWMNDNKTVYRDILLRVNNAIDGWRYRTSRPLAPPEGANRVRLRAIGEGQGGRLVFSDLSIRGSSPETREFRSLASDLPLMMDRYGMMFTRGPDDPFLQQTNIGIQNENNTSSRWATDMEPLDPGGEEPAIGTVFAPESFESVSFTADLQTSNSPQIESGMAVSYQFNQNLAVHSEGLSFPLTFVTGTPPAIPVRTERGITELSPGRQQEQVQAVEIQISGTNVLLQFAPAVRVSYEQEQGEIVLRTSVSLEQLLVNRGARGGNRLRSFRIHFQEGQLEGSFEGGGVIEPEEARSLLEEERWGELLSRLDDTLDQPGLSPGVRNELQSLESRLQRELQNHRERVYLLMTTSREMESLSLFESAQSEGEELFEKLGERASGETGELRNELNQTREQLDRKHREEEARELLLQSRRMKYMGLPGERSQLLETIIQEYPDTPAAETARQLQNQNQE